MHDSNTVTEQRLTPVGADTYAQLVLRGAGQIVVEFMSYGCEYCTAIEPVLQQVAAQSSMRFFRVNIAVEQELATTYNIGGTPTFVMFLNGKEVGRVEGPQPAFSTLSALLAEPFKT